MTRNQLKYLVIIAMVVDHLAWAFVPLASAPGQIMHFFGRLTGPVMAYFLAEGFIHTHDIRKYALRMGIFALISWIPFSLFETRTWPTTNFGVFYTLFLGLLTLIVLYRSRLPYEVRGLLAAGLLLLSTFGDWAYFDVIWPVIFYQFRGQDGKKWLLYCLTGLLVFVPDAWHPRWTVLCNLGIYMVPFLIHFGYNGQAGSRKPFHRWFFYIFYPAHLLILYYFRYR